MPDPAPDRLQRAILAAKTGELERARSLLLQIVQDQPRDLTAWLWLSSVVHSSQEKKVCLQRVLEIDPQHAAAQRGLAKLAEASPDDALPAAKRTFHREYQPISPAAAMLYPESHTRQWEDEPLVEFAPVGKIEYQAASTYDDVWTQNEEICAYCAQPVAWDQVRCPQCQRQLVEKHYRYPRPSANLYVLFVILLGSGVVFSIQLGYDLIARASAFSMAWHGLVALMLMVIAVAVYARWSWAYMASLLVFPVALLVAFTNSVETGLVTRYLAASPISPGLTLISEAIMGMVVAFIRPLQIMAAALGFFFAVFLCGSDFMRVDQRLIAQVEQGLRAAGDYYSVGRRYAERGMWATAILHWQRAAANEPNRHHYQRFLGEAYARLGFYQRSLDVLQSAYRLAVDPQSKGELEDLIQRVQLQAAEARQL